MQEGQVGMTTNTTLIGLADYAALDEPDERYLTELVPGVVVREPRPRHRHGELQVELAFHLRAWAGTHHARVTAESGYILSEDPATVRGPDVAVVLERRSGAGEPGGWVRGAADLAVEILSPADASSAGHQKTKNWSTWRPGRDSCGSSTRMPGR
jgi:Uma2 family endonuclease